MQNKSNIQIKERYRHYKTRDIYEIIDIAFLQAPEKAGLDMSECVIYKKVLENNLLDEKSWVRPVSMFLEKVKNENKEEVARFEKAEDNLGLKINEFEVWNKVKQEIENKKPLEKFHTKEIWWCSLGKNIGNEQDGKNNNFERPVLILKKWNSNFFIGIPMTTKKEIKEKDAKFYFKYFTNEKESSYFILTQVRVFSSKRLIRKLNSVRENIFNEIKAAVRSILLDV